MIYHCSKYTFSVVVYLRDACLDNYCSYLAAGITQLEADILAFFLSRLSVMTHVTQLFVK
jgi:hypothetical protein